MYFLNPFLFCVLKIKDNFKTISSLALPIDQTLLLPYVELWQN